MPFEVLTTTDADRWKETIQRLPAAARDVHMTVEYALVQERLAVMGDTVKAKLAVLSGPLGIAVQPFLLRNARYGALEAKDIVNLYGYGGHAPGFSLPLFKEVEAWCWSAGAVTEYCAMHPVLKNAPPDTVRAVRKRLAKFVVAIDLAKRPQDLLGSMSRRVRRGVKLAKEAKIKVQEVTPNVGNVDIFRDLYTESMCKLGAPQRWQFPGAYLAAHFSELGNQRARLFFATREDQVERALLTIQDKRTAYAHFLGSSHEHRDCGMDDLLYYEVAGAMQMAGCKLFHLGGGATSAPGDSLLAYKGGFSNLSLPVYTYTRVFDPERYRELCEWKRKSEVQNYGAESTSKFFPLYRREAA